MNIDQVGLGPERSESGTLHLLPPCEESREIGVVLGDYASTLVPSLHNGADEINALSSLSRGCNSICNCPMGKGFPAKSYLAPLAVKSIGDSATDEGWG